VKLDERRPVMSRARTLVRGMRRRPVVTVFVIALAVRVLVATAVTLLIDSFVECDFTNGAVCDSHSLIPDESQYLELGVVAAEGELAVFWVGYGESLYSSIRAFMWPVTAVLWLFGPHRYGVQLLVAVVGALAAAGTVVVARHWMDGFGPVAAGLLVAFMPSQILWSSVVLRESFVWAGVIGVVACVMVCLRSAHRGRVIMALCASPVFLLGLFWLRQQTALVVAWCLAPALLFARTRFWVRGIVAVLVLVVVPWVGNVGIAGANLIEHFPSLGAIRAWSAAESSSSFRPLLPVAVSGEAETPLAVSGEAEIGVGEGALPLSVPSGGSTDLEVDSGLESSSVPGCSGGSAGGAMGAAMRASSCREPTEPGFSLIDVGGTQFRVDSRWSTSLAAMPGGVVAFLARPFLWEGMHDPDRLFASVETLLWLAVYALALVGLWSRRHAPELWMFPAAVAGGLVAAVSLSAGNLGTAFRHRGQLLVLLAVPAVAGAEVLWRCWKSSRRDCRECNTLDLYLREDETTETTG